MAKEPPTPAAAPGTSGNITKKPYTKLPLLAKNQKISKRPLLHAPISSPRNASSTPKIIYVSSSSPFISVVKRVRTYLDEIEKRASGKLSLEGGDRRLLKGIERGVSGAGAAEDGKGKRDEEVVIKGTGKAIEKVVSLAAWWGQQSDVRVVVRTGSVGAVDDIVEKSEDGAGMGGAGGEESRIRRVSCLEVGIKFR